MLKGARADGRGPAHAQPRVAGHRLVVRVVAHAAAGAVADEERVVAAARDALTDMGVASAAPPAAALEERKKLAA